MENVSSLYHKVLVTNNSEIPEKQRTAFISKKDHIVFIPLEFAIDKNEVISILTTKPTPMMIIENNYYYVDVDWFVGNTPKENERYEVLTKIKKDLLDFIEEESLKNKAV